MEVTPGYKQTEVGVIPEDWEVGFIGQLFKLINGFAFKPEDWKQNGTPIIRIQNLNDSSASFNFSQLPIPEKIRVEPGDLLFAWSGTVGTSFGARIWRGPSGVLNQHIFKVMIDDKRIDLSFSLIVFSRIEEEIAKQAHGFKASFLHVKKSDLVKVKLPLPALPEQRAIATALSDMDALLDGLDRLIAKKRAIKQATMQKLLTGQTRLPGFSGEWEEKCLGDCLLAPPDYGINAPAVIYSAALPTYIRITDINDDGYFMPSPKVSVNSPFSSNYLLKDGDIVFARTGASVGKSYRYRVEDGPLVFAGFLIRVRPNPEQLVPSFLAVSVTTTAYWSWVRLMSMRSGQPGINGNEYASLPLRLPGIEEQVEIATILSDMDAEIIALETRRTKIGALKQAMMQELLTGRTRLIEPAENPIQKEVTHTEEHKANVHFLRSVLAAEIIDQLHDQPTFGHVKFEKMMFLAEQLCHVDTGSTYHRKAAGPYDNRALRSIDSQLQKQQWFEARKQDGRYQYVPLAKRGGHKPYFERHFSGIVETLEKILGTFKTAKTEQCEIVATLLAAWRDLLCEKGAVSDEMIVHEVLHNWHEAKQRIPEDRWLKALGWMREKGFVPQGVTLP